MKAIRLKSHAEQTAEFLASELRRGRWSGWMPGVLRLERQLGVNRNTIETALRMLEHDGLLVGQGAGKRRRIGLSEKGERQLLRVGILTTDLYDRGRDYLIELQHRLQEAGHRSFFARKTMSDLGMDLQRIVRRVTGEAADAWVVVSGGRDVLEWFETSGLPTFALFGRRTGLNLASAGPDKVPATLQAVRRLVELGHRRIVLLTRRIRRIPVPGRVEQAFLNELEALGLPTGPYNIPDWEDTPGGFHLCLEQLFRHTPPTAIIADEAPYLLAAMQFCGNHGLHIPQQVSLISTDADQMFALLQPQVAHIGWDPQPVIRRVLKWAEQLEQGRDDRRQTMTSAEFVEGGTMGQAPNY